MSRSPTPTRTSTKPSKFSVRRSRPSRPAREVEEDAMTLGRRHLLKLGGAALAGASVVPTIARAQTPKRGGTLAIRTWDPPHFDPFQTISFKTHIALSFTHSRLLRHKAGPSVVPGTFPIEGDLAESWTQPNETTYVFKLRKGVKWQAKP